jgi:hypothetical protein
MQLDHALLEGWMRDYYFETDLDIGSSGVHPYSFAEVRGMTGLTTADLDRVSFEDSWTLGGPGVRQALADRGMPIEEGTLYPLLRRLESQGLLGSQWQAESGPPRRYYSLSAPGARLLAELTASWDSLANVMSHLLKEENR